MRALLSEKNLVIVLFILVLIAFSFAHEDSKKMEQIFAGPNHSLNSSNTSLTQANESEVGMENKITLAADIPR